MKYGLGIFPTEDGLSPAELGLLAEDRGFESLFFPEHSHMPVDYTHPAWDPTGARIGPQYARVLEPFVALAAAATATERLNVGTGICLVAQRDPIQTAKTVTSLDWLSGGRFLFGVAPGWNREEMANHGYDFATRFSRMQEAIEAMKVIWGNDVASYRGRHSSFDKIESWPKPVQCPHPPVLLGGAGSSIIARVVALADEWLAEPEPDLEQRIGELIRAAQQADRDVRVTIYGAATGSAGHWASAGAHRCVYWLTPGDAHRQRSEIDSLARSFS
jgi:probable F420-dependent oxidoreductase